MSSYKRSNSEVHPYRRAENWLKPDWQFWEFTDTGIQYSDKSKEYYRGWVEEQRKLAERRCKEDAIS